MAVLFVLVFAILLLQLAISYSGMIRVGKPQTLVIDDRGKAEFLAQGLIDKAILKFQLFPADFYAAWEARKKNPSLYSTYLNTFMSDLQMSSNEASSSFSMLKSPFSVNIASISLYNNAKWNLDALYVEAAVTFQDNFGKLVNKSVTRVFTITHTPNKP